MAHTIQNSLVVELKDEGGNVCAVFKLDSQQDLQNFHTATTRQIPTNFQVTCLRLFVGNVVVKVKGDL